MGGCIKTDIVEKLIDVLKQNFYDEYEFEEIAKSMIANGVTVQELDNCDFCQKFDFDEQFKFCPMCGRKLTKQPKGD